MKTQNNSNNIYKTIPVIISCIVLLVTGCKKGFLDVVPDNLPKIENAFALRTEAEKYLFTCYSYLPDDGNTITNPAFLGGDEMCVPLPSRSPDYAVNIPRGNQTVVAPYFNYWDGSPSKSMFQGIRDCNVFIENMKDMSKVPDIGIDERNRWIAEGEFLKAYYHFILLRAYGPIPTIEENAPVDGPIENTKVRRMPVDSVVNFIVKHLDIATKNLPDVIQNTSNELGRITRPIALSVKARVLVLAASPLFNGNTDYTSFKDKQGVQLVSTTYDPKKWERAALACKAAITSCEGLGIQLYKFPTSIFKLSDTTIKQMNLRNAVSQKWQNQELIWGNPNTNTNNLQYVTVGHFDGRYGSSNGAIADVGVTLKAADLFYSTNGVPTNEDKTINFSDRSALRAGVNAERFNNLVGYTSSRLNFDRENRYYATLGFDGGIWYQENSLTRSDEGTYSLQVRLGGTGNGTPQPPTGYYAKKLVSWKFTWAANNSTSTERYPWPMFRLADLYLLYAESLNEFAGPSTEVYDYLNKIRERSGLFTVQKAWTDFSNNPGKYQNKDGLRSIIRQERGIELALEGSRFWDLRRWKTAGTELNGNVQGWDKDQADPTLYYRVITRYTQRFVAPRDYLWPIAESNLLINENLVQNPGW
jgi:hypothetical protein